MHVGVGEAGTPALLGTYTGMEAGEMQVGLCPRVR